MIYSSQPRPGQPLKLDFDAIRPFASDYDASNWRPHTRFPVLTSSSSTNLVPEDYTYPHYGSKISLDVRSIGASTQCSEKSRRRKRLQRKRRPGLTDLELTENSGTRSFAHLRQGVWEAGSSVLQSEPQHSHAETRTPTFSGFPKQSTGVAPRPSTVPDRTGKSITLPQRHPSDCSRYTVYSRRSSSSSDDVLRSDSMYHKAILALPRGPEYFLESLNEDLPAPLVPLKIRPVSKAPAVPRRQVSKRSVQSKQSEGDYDYVREWDQGWEDFDTMLDNYQRSFSDEDTSALYALGRYDLPGTSKPAAALERWRSRWSDDSSESSSTQYKELPLPPLAHLPDLESDSISTPSSPISRGPNTPFLQNCFPPLQNPGANQSHISLCVAEPRTPTSLRHHGGSHSLDSAHSKSLPSDAKHKQSVSICIGSIPKKCTETETQDSPVHVSVMQPDEVAPPHYLELHRRGGFEDLKHWPTREEFGAAF